MARQGRQPGTGGRQSTSSAPTSSKPKGSKKSKTSLKAKIKSIASNDTSLDIYSYSSSIKRPRGDVDPESRANSSARTKKGKGKEQEEDEQDEDEAEDEDEFRGDGIVEFNGIKPEGLYMGADEDDQAVFNSEDDEEIDSDEAFEDEDDLPKKVKGGSKPKTKASRRPAEIDLDEDEIDMDDEEGGNFMDASEMLDASDYDSESEEEDDEEHGQDEEQMRSESEEESEVDSEYEGALDKLSSFVDGLEGSKKRKAGDELDDVDDGGKKKKRVVLKERTEAWPEGEFVAVTAADGVADSKLSLEDLLSSFAGSKNPKLAALRKTLKPLAAVSAVSTSTTTSASHLKAAGPLAAPLPARLQDKIEREAGYEKTKEETDKWNETVRRMKGESGIGVEGARHERLTLPLMSGGGDVLRSANANEWNAKFEPANKLESTIEALLTAGQMQSSDLRKAEKDALAALDPADVAARQAELRQQRDLMFRAERKAKRVAKIKSKAFRRIHRREKGKLADGAQLSLEDMEEMDRLDGGDRVVEEKARMEVARARERATLKHSTKGGRWSKTVGGIEGLDEERNTAVRDMVARGEELRKRIAGVDPNDNSGDEFEGDSSEEDEEDADLDRIRDTAFDELASLDRKEAAAAAADGPGKLKGVLNMKFMKDALARDQRRTQNSADELRRTLEEMDGAGVDIEMEDSEADPVGMSEQVEGNLGRLVFGPSATESRSSQPTITVPTTRLNQNSTKLSGPLAIASTSSHFSSRSPLSLASTSNNAESNPWTTIDEDSASTVKQSRKMNKATVGKDSRDAVRLAAKVDRHRSKMTDAREADADDAQVDINPDIVLSLGQKVIPQLIVPSTATKSKSKKGPVTKATARSTQVEDGIGSSDEEDNEAEHKNQAGRGPAAFKQRDLVARAFSGDDVVADFEAEKRKIIERDAPKEEDNTLPGWGTWSGKGVKKPRNPKKFITKIAGIEAAQRKDAALSHVIISEKKDNKAGKYLLKDLPFPYTSAAQHEHKLRTPLGPEWSTGTILRDQVMPKILIKPGVTIRPVDRRD